MRLTSCTVCDGTNNVAEAATLFLSVTVKRAKRFDSQSFKVVLLMQFLGWYRRRSVQQLLHWGDQISIPTIPYVWIYQTGILQMYDGEAM